MSGRSKCPLQKRPSSKLWVFPLFQQEWTLFKKPPFSARDTNLTGTPSSESLHYLAAVGSTDTTVPALRESWLSHLPWRLTYGHRSCPITSFRALMSPPSLQTWLFYCGASLQTNLWISQDTSGMLWSMCKSRATYLFPTWSQILFQLPESPTELGTPKPCFHGMINMSLTGNTSDFQ